MKRFLIAATLTVGLAGCNADPNVATPNQVVIAVNAYNAAVATGTAYLKLPVCGYAPCRTVTLSQNVYTALKAGRVARSQLLTALETDQAAPITTIQTLEAAYAVIQQIPRQ